MHTVHYSLHSEPNTECERDFAEPLQAVMFADSVIEDGGSAYVMSPYAGYEHAFPGALCDVFSDEILF